MFYMDVDVLCGSFNVQLQSNNSVDEWERERIGESERERKGSNGFLHFSFCICFCAKRVCTYRYAWHTAQWLRACVCVHEFMRMYFCNAVRLHLGYPKAVRLCKEQIIFENQ